MKLTAWKSGLAGFLICAALSFAIYLAAYLGAERVAETHVSSVAAMFGESEAHARAWLVKDVRRIASEGGTFLAIVFAAYWSVSILVGKGRVAALPLANALLLLATVGILAVWMNAYIGWADTYCDQLPFSHEGFQLSKINECPSSSIFFSALMNISLLMFGVSLIVRIWTSRHKAKQQ